MRTRFTFLLKVYCIATSWSLGLGVALVLGGEKRFSGDMMKGARSLAEITPFIPAHIAWGVAFLAAGSALLVALGKRWAQWALLGNLVLYTFFVVGFVMAGTSDHDRTITPLLMITFTIGAVLSAALMEQLVRRGWAGA